MGCWNFRWSRWCFGRGNILIGYTYDPGLGSRGCCWGSWGFFL